MNDPKAAMDAAAKEDVNDAKTSNRRYNELMRRPIIPENMRDDAEIVRIRCGDHRNITIEYKYDENFINAAHDAHMKWWCAAQKWWYTISPQSSWRDCVAEIATIFLAAGFPVRVHPCVRDMVALGNYEPEYVRWIEAGRDQISILIKVGSRYDSRFSGMYQKAMKIPGAKYESEYVRVGIKHRDEIEGFADENGYRITDDARNLLASMQSGSVRVSPKKVQLDTGITPLSGDDLLKALRDD